MRIEELVLEGFKSYPVRTQITGWDPSFNAITGLNGSGKSNILDAICFVLGMTNVSQMRASSQQDLIYKRGQAGITKASVTIVFDNSDREKSPLGLEEFKQITVTRQVALPNISKYLLNGHKATQQQIQNLFQSVQLNINNPNFLIMQGKITKVLNMRPPEILSLVEEAAGTRMFEDRKSKAIKTMAKKDKKVAEIQALLDEEITPKLDNLRKEKAKYQEHLKNLKELERTERVLNAWWWDKSRKDIAHADGNIKKLDKSANELAVRKEKISEQIGNAEEEVEEVQRKRDAELKKGGKMKKLEEAVAEHDKLVTKLATQLDIKQSSIADEENTVNELKAALADQENSLMQKDEEIKKLTNAFAGVESAYNQAEADIHTAEELLQTLLTGLSSNKGSSGGGYMGQLADAKARLAQAETEAEQARTKLSMSGDELKGLEKQWGAFKKEANDSQRKVDEMRKQVQASEAELSSLGWSETKENELEQALRGARDKLRQVTQKRDTIKQRLSNLAFDYSSPYPNFDRSKVKGLVASLVALKSESRDMSTALEITAGGRLYNVVVQDEQVGKDLLQKGGLRKRVTIIPLNKINSNTMHTQKVQHAQQLAPGKVNLALSLITYASDVKAAMAFVFGNTIIASDPETAKKVTFGAGVRTVTRDGDVYDPSGTLSGGAAPSSSGELLRVQELVAAENEVAEAQEALNAITRQEEQARDVRTQWQTKSREVEIAKHQLKLLEEQVNGSNASRLASQIEKLKSDISEFKTLEENAVERQKAAKVECKKLEKDMEEFKNNKDGKIDELKASISKKRSVIQKQAVAVKMQGKELQTAKLEREQIEKDIEQARENIQKAQKGVEKLQKEHARIEEDLQKEEDSLNKTKAKLAEERAILTQFDKELEDLEEHIRKEKKRMTDIDLELKTLEHDLSGIKKERNAAEKRIEELEQTYDWIKQDCHEFGKQGMIYDFSKTNPVELQTKFNGLKESGKKKKINHKAVSMLESVEKRETALNKMLQTVLKDKQKIEDTIEELDRYKRDALKTTWEKVNGDFGGIFAELLPGNFAKLQPPEGQDLMDGLEVKVQLGSVWKQSLTELSGGQRSLIALSLIMALLQFKPAPMYILDEIDAALDLSHTQHIGQLFRTRFKGSQFIVVSLKEGLFTNANVLFRARFRDGTSIVERTAQRSTNALYNNSTNNNSEESGATRRAPRRVAA